MSAEQLWPTTFEAITDDLLDAISTKDEFRSLYLGEFKQEPPVFAHALQRLRVAAHGQRGRRDDVVVDRRDLAELLYQFDRLEREAAHADR